MKNITKILLFILSSALIYSQGLDLQVYNKFLEKNQNLNSEGLYSMYKVGLFNSKIAIQSNADYYSDVINKYKLTDYEKKLISKHGFMVTERLSFESFGACLKDIWEKDLPVFISTDAILHALHMSYDAILKDIEQAIIIGKLDTLLRNLHTYTPVLCNKYGTNPIIKQSIDDYDVYLAVALTLLNEKQSFPVYSENKQEYERILKNIELELPHLDDKLFTSTGKMIDYSQFTVRGHYTDSKELSRYFKAMMWLGRIEFYQIAPQPAALNPQKPEDIQRQIIDAFLLYESAEATLSVSIVNEIDNIIKAIVGESDNVQLKHIKELSEELSIIDATEFLDTNRIKEYQELLATKSYADQKILSQMIWGSPFETNGIKPASAFLLMGQRFIIDSYVMGNVVWDKTEAKRMLPSSLDVLFALGNNASADLLKDELERYGYAKNLAGLRYLVDTYDKDFWNNSVYNCWLNTIRTLNAPDDEKRKAYPDFMRTAAWWQEKMNTQLASWAQLRHDNLLYAKQSYSGMVSCSYPEGYVEPIPEFYEAIYNLAINASAKLNEFLIGNNSNIDYLKLRIKEYFKILAEKSIILNQIAIKELEGTFLSSEEKQFLSTTYSESPNCGPPIPIGWYAHLFYNSLEDINEQDYVIADVHTAPTDDVGNIVGWVYHVGTGPINMAVVLAPNTEGKLVAFCGPVMSYFEHISLNFKRLTDEEWENMYSDPMSLRPDWVNLYLARNDGNTESENPPSLPTGLDEPINPTEQEIISTAYPNPFSNNVLIIAQIPENLYGRHFKLNIYDINGMLIKELFYGQLPSGNYSFKWDGKDTKGNNANSGAYIYKLEYDSKSINGKILLTR